MDEAQESWLIGYARISTGSQKLDLQVDALRRAGVPDERIFTDVMSAASTKRPGLKAAFKFLRPGACLVVWRLDRLGRSVVGILETLQKLKERGAEVRSLTEALDTRTATGKLVINMLAMLAQYERDLIIERTVAGQQAARERGKIIGKRPYMTLERTEEARKLIADGVPKNEAAKRIGVSRATLYNWLQEERERSGTPGPGRRPRMTSERVDQAQELLAEGVPKNEIPKRIGVGQTTFYAWLRDQRGLTSTTDDLE